MAVCAESCNNAVPGQLRVVSKHQQSQTLYQQVNVASAFLVQRHETIYHLTFQP